MIIHNEGNCQYLTKLPGEAAIKVRSVTGVELMQLKQNKKKWSIGNIEPRDSLPLLLFSPSSNRYWMRTLGADHDINSYRRYIKDGNLYILFNDEWKARVITEREKEGMSYFDYNKTRELLLLQEIISKKEGTDIKTKLRAIQLQLNQINNKYEKR